MCFHYCLAGEVLASDQLDVLKLTTAFLADGIGDLRINRCEGVSDVFLVDKGVCCHRLVFYKLQKNWKSPLEGVTAAFVGFASKTDRVGYVRRAGFELAQEIGLLSSLRKKQFDQALVIARHRENMRGLPDEFLRNRLAAEVCQINAVNGQRLNRMPAGRHATSRAYTRRLDVDVIASIHELLEKPLSHRAAADIAGANKKDMLHEQFQKWGRVAAKSIARAESRWSCRRSAEAKIPQDACEEILTRLCSNLPMSDLPEEWVFLKTAWRFAFLLTGCREGTSKVFKDSVDELLRHPHPGDLERARQLFFTVVRRRGLKFAARCELQGMAAKLHELPEPGRSALALLYLDALPAVDIQRVLNIDERLLAEAMDKARSALREKRATTL